MVFYVALRWNSFEFLKNITVFIVQVTIATIYRMINTIQNQKFITFYYLFTLSSTFSPLLYIFRWMYRWLLLLLVLTSHYRLCKLYKSTIHIICTTTFKQQLKKFYSLFILCRYCTAYLNTLGNIQVCLYQLAVGVTCVQARIQ